LVHNPVVVQFARGPNESVAMNDLWSVTIGGGGLSVITIFQKLEFLNKTLHYQIKHKLLYFASRRYTFAILTYPQLPLSICVLTQWFANALTSLNINQLLG